MNWIEFGVHNKLN